MRPNHGAVSHDVASRLDELRVLPLRPLRPEDVRDRRVLLEQLDGLLGRAGRTLVSAGQREAHQYLQGLVERESRRLAEAERRPQSVVERLSRLEEQWLHGNPGEALDLRPCLTLVLEEPASHRVRACLDTFTVSLGEITLASSRLPYRLLVSPNWFASFLPTSYRGAIAGATGTLAAQALLEGFDHETVAMVLALWSDDPRADLFQPPSLVEAVRALDQSH